MWRLGPPTFFVAAIAWEQGLQVRVTVTLCCGFALLGSACSGGPRSAEASCVVVADHSGGLAGEWYVGSAFEVMCTEAVAEIGLQLTPSATGGVAETVAAVCVGQPGDGASAGRLACEVPALAPAPAAQQVSLCNRDAADGAWVCAPDPVALLAPAPPAVALLGLAPPTPDAVRPGGCLELQLGPGVLHAAEGRLALLVAAGGDGTLEVPVAREPCAGLQAGDAAASVVVDVGWMGLPDDAPRQVLVQPVQEDLRGVRATGAARWLTLPAVLAPQVEVLPEPYDARRGAWLGVRLVADGDARLAEATTARLRLDGFISADDAPPAPVVGWTVPMAARADGWQAVLDTATWSAGPWSAWHPGARFEGEASVLLSATSGGAVWRSTGQPLSFALAATRQDVVIVAEDAFIAGLEPYGLAAAADPLRARIEALAQEAFSGLRVHVRLAEPADQAEFVRVALLDRDPNGLGLLGVDSSPGKDVGNSRLDEALVGYGAAAALDGAPAHGGVFLDSFFRFSPTVGGISSIADPAFDSIFGALAPELGGEPWAPDDGPDSARQEALDQAVETLAQLVASTLVHEVGHTLGLCAVEGRFHHQGDNPGWIMDAGLHRSFAERAGLPGAPARTWGPVDAAYLQAVLGESVP